MPRTIDSTMLGGLVSGDIAPIYLVDLTFASGPTYVWSGFGDLNWNGKTYQGVGDLGTMGDVGESLVTRADGTTLTLSGVNTALLNDCMQDIQIGAPVTVWFGLFSQGQVLGAPATLFSGIVDKPAILVSAPTMSITLHLESRMLMFQRPTARRYTAADQRIQFPDDSAFDWVEILSDMALHWGN